MTVPSSQFKQRFVGDGTQLVFPFRFKVQLEDDLEVTLDDVPAVLNTDYTVHLYEQSGYVRFATAPDAAAEIFVLRNVRPLQQLIDLNTYDGNEYQGIEYALDRLVMAYQEYSAGSVDINLSGTIVATSDITGELLIEGEVLLQGSTTGNSQFRAFSYFVGFLQNDVNFQGTIQATSSWSGQLSAEDREFEGTISATGIFKGSGTNTIYLADRNLFLEGEISASSLIVGALDTVGQSSLLHTVTVRAGSSGAARTRYVTLGLPIEPGLFDPTNQKIQVREFDGVTDVTTQQDLICTNHFDGSCNHVTISFETASMAPGTNRQYRIYSVTGTPDESFLGEDQATSKGRITSRNSYFRVNIENDGDLQGYYSATLTDLLAGAILTKEGPLCRQWVADRPLVSAAFHPHMWIRVWATVWNDGTTIDLFAQLINGFGRNPSPGQASLFNYNLRDIEFYIDGALEYALSGSPFIQQYPRTCISLPEGSGKPYWFDDTDPDIEVTFETDRLQKSFTFLPYYVQDSSEPPVAGFLDDYSVYMPGEYRLAMDDEGDTQHIGMMPSWSTYALLQQTAAWQKADRIQALAFGRCPIYYWEETTRRVPMILPYSASYNLGVISYENLQFDNSTTHSGAGYSGVDANNFPNPFLYQAATSGQPWFLSMMLASASFLHGIQSADPLLGRRDIEINSRVFRQVMNWRGQPGLGGVAWQVRQWSDVSWLLPDEHYARTYVTEVQDDNIDFIDWKLKNAAALGGLDDRLRALGLFDIKFEENINGDVGVINVDLQCRMIDQLNIALCLAYLRGQVAVDIIENMVEVASFNRSTVGSAHVAAHADRLRHTAPGPGGAGFSTFDECFVGRIVAGFYFDLVNDAASYPADGLYNQPPPEGSATVDDNYFLRSQSSTYGGSFACINYAIANVAKYVNLQAGIRSEGTPAPSADAIADYLALENPGVALYDDEPKYAFRYPRTI